MSKQQQIQAALVAAFEEVNSLARLFGDDPEVSAAEQKLRSEAYFAKHSAKLQLTVTCQVLTGSLDSVSRLTDEPLRLEVLLYPSGRIEARQISESTPASRIGCRRYPLDSGCDCGCRRFG